MKWISRDKAAVPEGNRVRGKCRTLLAIGLGGFLILGSNLRAAELSVADLKIRPHGQGQVVVSGTIDGESTFGVTVMVEVTARPGSTGTLEFTPVLAQLPAQRKSFSVHRRPGRLGEVRVAEALRPEVDIVQRSDPWPDQGTFSAFDTDHTSAPTLNGAVDDNGTFVAEPVTFSGPLSVFPVRASKNARGVWDVTLATSKGNSSWEGVETRLVAGTITVTSDACASNRDCRDRDPRTVDTCEAGTCQHTEQQGPDSAVKARRERVGGRTD